VRRLRVVWKRIAPIAVPALVLLALVLVMFWRLWTPLEGERRSFGYDAQWEYWGDVQFQVDSIGQGHLPMWNPYDRLGYPFHADPQTGTLYPPQWGLWAIAAVIGSVPWWLVAVKLVLHLWWAGLGAYLVCMRRKLPPAACYLAGILILTSYPVLHNAGSALNWSFAWTPWLLLALDAWTERPTAHRGGLVALTAAMGVLAGGLAGIWYGLLLAIPWGLIELQRHRTAAHRAGHGKAYDRELLRSIAVAAGLFAMLVIAQLLATKALLPDTVRDRRGVEFIGTTVFDAVDVVGFFVPRMQGENTYLGLAPILWVGALLIVRPTGRNLIIGSVFILGALCAMGDRGPVLSALASIVPPFGMFRRAHRYLYVGVVPMAILAAEGMAFLAAVTDERTRRVLRRGLTIAAGVALAACVVGFAARARTPWAPDQVRDAFGFGVASAVIAGGLSWWLLRGGAEWRRIALGVATAAIGLELWVCRAKDIEAALTAVPVAHHDEVVRVPDLPLEHRIYDRGWLGFRPGTRLALRDLGGYEGDPLALSRFEMVRQSVNEAPRRMAELGIAYYFESTEAALRIATEDAQVLTRAGNGRWTVKAPAPSVSWYDTAEIAADSGAAWRAATAAPPGSKAVLEAGTLDADQVARAARVDAAATPVVAGRLEALDADSLRATIDAPGDGLVVINELYYARGWTAQIDGNDAPIVPAQGYARGVFVGVGHHVIALRYADGTYLLLVLLQPLALLIIGLLSWRGWRREHGAATDLGPAEKTPTWNDDDPRTAVDVAVRGTS
jgi:hypothetical protein